MESDEQGFLLTSIGYRLRISKFLFKYKFEYRR